LTNRIFVPQNLYFMNSEHIFYVIIGILTAQFTFDQWLDFLNNRKVVTSIPTELEGIYDEEKYKKQQNHVATWRRMTHPFNGVFKLFKYCYWRVQ